MATISSAPIRSSEPFQKESLNQSISQSNDAERDLQSNRIPDDKEDPRQSTKALPFASTNEQECEDLIKSGSEPSIQQQAKGMINQGKEAINQSLSHNGNVLDRTMDQIRGWVHSFKAEPQYEEYEIEVDEAEESAKQSINEASNKAAQMKDSAASSINQAGASAKQSLNQAAASASSTAASAKQAASQSINQASASINQATDSAKQSLNQASNKAAQMKDSAAGSINQAASQASIKASQAKDSAASSINQAANQASNKAGQLKESAAGTINQLSNQASNQAQIASSKLGSLKDQVVHTVSDLGQSVSSSISQYSGKLQESIPDVSHLRESVTEYYQSSSIPQTINENMPDIPSSDQIRESASRMLPPLAQQASSSWAFAGSFLAQYMQNMKQFMFALRQQNAVMLTLTALTFVNHFVVPWFFFDKSAARSVIYSYVLASLAAHATFFLSGHLRYQWLGHLLFVPMVMSLFFNQGFREAGDVAELIDSFKQGDRFGTAVSAPFSLRSYLFVLWMRGILMNQAVLGAFDLVNIMDLMGLNMNTRLGEEMPLIQGSVKNFRRSLAASVHGAADSLDVNERSHRGHGRKRRGSAQSNHPNQQNQQRERSSPAPQQHQPQQAQHQQVQHSQHWVKKSQDSGNNNKQSSQQWSDKSSMSAQPQSDSVVVESHERQSSNELRQRLVPHSNL